MELDDTDWKLLSLLSDSPDISQSELSKELGITQPAICLRLKKLQEKRILKRLFGLCPHGSGFYFCLAQGKGKLSKLSKHPHFVCGFSSDDDVSAIFFGASKESALSVAKSQFKNAKLMPLNNVEGAFVIPIKSQEGCEL